MIRVDVPDVASAGTLIRLLIGTVDATSISLDAAGLSVCVDDPAVSPGTVAKRVERWLAEIGADTARVHDDRGWFVVRHLRRPTAAEAMPEPTTFALQVALAAVPAVSLA